jgi:hypothetical protein
MKKIKHFLERDRAAKSENEIDVCDNNILSRRFRIAY